MHTLCLGIGRLIRWGSCGDPESYAAARGVWFPNRPIIIVIKWVRFLSSFFISSNSATETIACWASWFFILVYDLVRIRLLNRGEAFLGAIVNYHFIRSCCSIDDVDVVVSAVLIFSHFVIICRSLLNVFMCFSFALWAKLFLFSIETLHALNDQYRPFVLSAN